MDVGMQHVLVDGFCSIVSFFFVSERKLRVRWERNLLRMKEDVRSMKRENSFPWQVNPDRE